MENDTFNFLMPSFSEEEHPIDMAVNFWVEKNVNYKKLLLEGRMVPPFIMLAKLCVRDNAFQKQYAEDYIDGWVLFSKGITKGDSDLIDKAEGLMKPMMDKIINYLSSDSFKKYVLNLHVSGEEKVPISIPEIFITVNELLLYSRRKKEIFVTSDQVDALKQNYVLDKIKGWGIIDLFGEKIKGLEHFVHPEVFNPNGFLVFDFLMKSQDFKKRGAATDISFFYHQMKKAKLIHAGRDTFKKWVNKFYSPYNPIEKIHDLRSRITSERKERYLEAIALIKSKKD